MPGHYGGGGRQDREGSGSSQPSGSTGSPKFVKLSYSNLLDNASKIAQYLNIKSSDRPITTMQPSYSYGLSIINSHLIKGASIIMRSPNCIVWDSVFPSGMVN